MTKSTRSALETKIKQGLDQTQANFDVETQQRLNAMRKQAVQQDQRPVLVNWFGDAILWLKQPAGNMVLASVLAIALLLPQLNQQSFTDQGLNQTALLELIEAPEAESLDETTDPDFYLWLAEVDGQNA